MNKTIVFFNVPHVGHLRIKEEDGMYFLTSGGCSISEPIKNYSTALELLCEFAEQRLKAKHNELITATRQVEEVCNTATILPKTWLNQYIEKDPVDQHKKHVGKS